LAFLTPRKQADAFSSVALFVESVDLKTFRELLLSLPILLLAFGLERLVLTRGPMLLSVGEIEPTEGAVRFQAAPDLFGLELDLEDFSEADFRLPGVVQFTVGPPLEEQGPRPQSRGDVLLVEDVRAVRQRLHQVRSALLRALRDSGRRAFRRHVQVGLASLDEGLREKVIPGSCDRGRELCHCGFVLPDLESILGGLEGNLALRIGHGAAASEDEQDAGGQDP
jgi:hypothetical protein